MSASQRPESKSIQPPANPKNQAKQQGWTCHLYALAFGLDWLKRGDYIQKKPLAASKRDYQGEIPTREEKQPASLREALKKIVAARLTADEKESSSSTSEPISAGILTDARDYLQLAKQHPEITASAIGEFKNKDSYCQNLTSAIDKNLLPIVFFEASPEGTPMVSEDGAVEHASVVVEYFYKEDNLYFKVVHWQKTQEILADELYKSTTQALGSAMTQGRVFKKFTNKKDKQGIWLVAGEEKYYSRSLEPDSIKVSPAKYYAIDDENYVRGKIFLLDTMHRAQKLLDQLGAKLAESQNQDQAHDRALSHLAGLLKENLAGNRDVMEVIINKWQEMLTPEERSALTADDQQLLHRASFTLPTSEPTPTSLSSLSSALQPPAFFPPSPNEGDKTEPENNSEGYKSKT